MARWKLNRRLVVWAAIAAVVAALYFIIAPPGCYRPNYRVELWNRTAQPVVVLWQQAAENTVLAKHANYETIGPGDHRSFRFQHNDYISVGRNHHSHSKSLVLDRGIRTLEVRSAQQDGSLTLEAVEK